MSMRVGIFIDAANLGSNGGSGMRYDVLSQLATCNGDVAQRLNVYLAYDTERAETDYKYRTNSKTYHQRLRGFGFKVIIKEVKTYSNPDGSKTSKSNADMELAVDMLLQSDKLDRIILGSGDGDFSRVVTALQDKGLRVDVLSFRNFSRQLIHDADSFISGYLIPNLVPNPYYSHIDGYNQQDNQKYSDDNEFQAVGVVVYTNVETHKSVIRYLEKPPGSFLDTDAAWTEIEVDVSQEDIRRHTMMKGNIISWLADPQTMKPLPKNKFIKIQG